MFQAVHYLLDALLPRRCVRCDAYDHWFCRACRHATIQPRHQAAANALTIALGLTTISTLSNYAEPSWQAAIRLLKFHHIREVADLFGWHIDAALKNYPYTPANTVLVPVPLHPTRERERGYNQAWLIARALSRYSHIPVVDGAVVRRVHTPSQTSVSHVERSKRMCNVFSAGTSGAAVTGKHVILIDDVITTGATALGVARILASQKPTSIHICAIARAFPDGYALGTIDEYASLTHRHHGATPAV